MQSGSDQRSGGAGRGDGLQVLVVQSHPLLASAIAGILGNEADISICGIARTGAEAAAAASRSKATVVVIDSNLPDMSGAAAAALIHAGSPEVAIVFHSAEESETALLDAIDAGATAYLTKAATEGEIIHAVRRGGRGEVLIPAALFAKAIARHRNLEARQKDRGRLSTQFTDRELQVLKLLAEGLDTVSIAQHLGIAPHTVQWHIRHLIEKLHVHSKLQALIAAARLGLIDLASR
ncbi:MAG TPA: response regulator transcription factor [Candidatus Dormibacteraeota bacterium]|nr:response regulator transcription factor [Candidatus Dormibacteraeota bacterium]